MANPFARLFQKTPGYAGGSLEEQLERERLATQQRQVTPQNREAITRPRQVNQPLPAEMAAPPEATRERAVSFDVQTGKPKDEFYQNNPDPLQAASGLYNAYQKWAPRGAKRGFKNSLKAGAMMAAEAVNANPENPVEAALAGFGVGAAGATAVPDFKNRLTRKWKMRETGGELQGQLKIAGEQAKIDQSQMVPVPLSDGRIIQVPAKSVGTVVNQDRSLGARADTLEARKKRWDALGSKERRQLIIQEYRAGMLNNDPKALEQAAKELDIPGELLPAFISGKMRDAIDDEGNIIQVNRQTGTVTPIGAKSIEVTKEAGRNRRATASQQGQNARAAMRGTGQARTQGADRVSMRKAAELAGKIERARKAMALADEALSVNPNNADAKRQRGEAQAAGESWAVQLNGLGAGYEAGPGEKGYPYYKKNEGSSDLDKPIYGKPTGRTIEGAVKAFTKKAGRAPTTEEIAKMKAAL